MLLSFATLATATAEPKRILLLHSFGRDFKPWSDFTRAIRAELDRQSPWPLDLSEHSLITARFSDENPEVPFVDYLRALYAKQRLDLIVSIGAPAAAFVQRHRQQLFATTPMVFTAVEQRRVQYSLLTANDTVVAFAHDFRAVFLNILRVLPDTATVAVVNGNSSNENFWLEEMRRETKRFENRISFIWYSDLSFEEILKHAAALPPQSAIFWHLMNVDAAGVVHEGDRALTRLHAVANAPIFSHNDAFFGRAIVGGPMHSVSEGSAWQPPWPFASLAARGLATSRYRPADSQRRSSTGGKCSAGVSASAACCREARFTFAARLHGSNTVCKSWRSVL
jgi:hypothetical protein